MMRTILLCLGSCGLLNGCAVASLLTGVGGVVETDYSGVNPAEDLKTIGRFSTKTHEPVQVQGKARHLQGVKTFAVPFYRVKFREKDKTSENKGTYEGGGESGNAKNVLRSELRGMDPARYDAITAEAYADFVSRLHQAGVTVIDHRQMASYRKYREKASGRREADGIHYAVPPWATYAEAGRLGEPLQKLQMAEKVNVLGVDLDVSFMIVNHNFARFSLAAKEKLYNSQGANVMGTLRAIVPKAGVTLAMGQRAWSDIPFGYIEDVNQTGNLVGSLVTTGLMALTSGGRANWKDQVVHVSDQDAYAEAVRQALLEANERLAAALLAEL